MKTFTGVDSARPTSVTRKRWLITGAAVLVVLVLLLIFAPALVMLLSIPAFIIALIALVVGGLRWAGIRNRGVAGGLLGGTFVLFIISMLIFGSSLPTVTTDQVAEADTPSATPSAEPELASFVGEACDANHLVMTQGPDSLYCDVDGDGNLVWFTAVEHDAALKAAQKEADEKKAAAERAAAEEAEKKAAAEMAAAEEAEKKAAAEMAAAEEAAEKEAAEQAAAEQAAAEKATAEKAAAEEAAAERAAAAEAEAARKAARQTEQKQKAPVQQQAPVQQAPVQQQAPATSYYKNCDAVRAAGAAPIRAGQPGYSRKLDRDGDGIGCE